jgi:hypothetical protein
MSTEDGRAVDPDDDDDSAAVPSWVQMYPGGRWIWYEGDTPEKFAAEVLAETGFDVRPHWEEDPSGWQFFCPPQYLDAIYGGRWPVGS